MRKETTDSSNPFVHETETWELILFVAGNNVGSQRIQSRLEGICEAHLQGRYRLVLVNIFEQFEEAYKFDVIATPTVVRQNPKPVRKVIGDLSFTDNVISGLGLPPIERSG